MPDYSLGMKIIKAGIVLVGMGRAGRVTLIVMLATANIILGFKGRGPNQAMQDKGINKSGTNETTMQVKMMSMQKNIIHKIAAGGLLRQGKSAIEHRRGWEVVGDRDPIVQRGSIPCVAGNRLYQMARKVHRNRYSGIVQNAN